MKLKNALITGLTVSAVAGMAIAGPAPRSAAPMNQAQAMNTSSAARSISVKRPASKGKTLVGLRFGTSMVQSGTLKDQVKNGQAAGIFVMFPLQEKLSLIVDAGMTKYKAKGTNTKDLEKLGGSAGVIYNIFDNKTFKFGLGGELGYAKYETKATGGTNKDESKMFYQLDGLGSYDFGNDISGLLKVSYSAVSIDNLDGLNLKKSKYLGASLGIAKAF